MTKEQLAAIAVVLLLGVVFFVRLYRRQQEPPKEPPKPKPLPKIGKMRCPMFVADAKVTGKQSECPCCGDCGWIKYSLGIITSRLNVANIKKNHLLYS